MKQDRLNKQSNKSSRLDLGLSSILSSFSESDSSSPSTPASTSLASAEGQPNFILVGVNGVALTSTLSSPPVKQKSQFEVLAEGEQWAELAQLCETHISKQGESRGKDAREVIEARLWWIKSNLVNGGVPMSILAAPLESVSASIAELHSSSAALSEDERTLVSFCADLLKEVAGRLVKNAEAALGLNFLERAYALDSTCGPQLRAALEPEIARLRNNPRFERDSKLKARVARFEDLLRTLKQHKVEVAEATREKPQQQAAENPASSASTRSRRPLYLAVALMLALAIAAGLWTKAPSYLGRERLARASKTILSPSEPRLLIPEVPRVSGLSSLDALYYDIDNSSRTESRKRPAPVEPQVAADASVVPSVKDSVVTQAKVQVDTSGPLEGPEFQNLKAEDLDPSDGRRDDLFRGLTSGPSQSSGGLQGLPVEKFDSDKLYLVLTKTNVMARPSFHTAALAELESGDKVLVESKVGPWLKLRSKHGQAGYILAQDAELTTKR
ncbi:MAG: hypothetical protein J0M12_02515 [Deltaproteobacteria bacterium]|nr:hypothetical protein [Deltaproteobacteria bacterium]